jgi:hypothetical protein
MKEKAEHGLSEAELFLADALSDGSWEQTAPEVQMRPADPQPDFLYFAMKVHGGRVEISGEPTAFMA